MIPKRPIWGERPLKPYKSIAPVVWLNPDKVQLIRTRRPSTLQWLSGAELWGLDWPMRRGRWDRSVAPFRDHPVYAIVRELAQSSLDYRQTSSFRAALRQLESRGKAAPVHGGRCYRDRESLENYFEGVARLMESMAKHGYDLDKASPMPISVGRNGELIKEKHGHHRLAAAQFLRLREVPFAIFTVHTQWLAGQFWVLRNHPETLKDALS